MSIRPPLPGPPKQFSITSLSKERRQDSRRSLHLVPRNCGFRLLHCPSYFLLKRAIVARSLVHEGPLHCTLQTSVLAFSLGCFLVDSLFPKLKHIPSSFGNPLLHAGPASPPRLFHPALEVPPQFSRQSTVALAHSVRPRQQEISRVAALHLWHLADDNQHAHWPLVLAEPTAPSILVHKWRSPSGGVDEGALSTFITSSKYQIVHPFPDRCVWEEVSLVIGPDTL